jgi:hypothetical protein
VLLSPQYFAEALEAIKKRETQSAGREKRRHVRYTVVSRVDVLHPASGRTYAALTHDLSQEGIGLIQSASMQRGELMAVSLPRAKNNVLVALCKVAHARELADGVWGVGATFVSLTVPDALNKTAAAEAERIASRMLG